MAKRPALLETIVLSGLEVAPSQVSGAVRLVPLLRSDIRSDLRLAQRRYHEEATVVSLGGRESSRNVSYVSFIPHALVVAWSNDGTTAATLGAHLYAPDGQSFGWTTDAVRLAHRMVLREDEQRLRLLPLHLAMEGFLALHFGGPDVAWSEYSKQALSRGLDPRTEVSVTGSGIPGLADALRVFEIHEQQVGVLVFVADVLASAFVMPHPDDYRALHESLLDDFYASLFLRFGAHATSARLEFELDDSQVSSLADIRRELDVMSGHWSACQQNLASGLFGARVKSERVYRMGPFQLQRFSTNLELSQENHIGEAIVRDDGNIEYLKTYRLTGAQSRRAFLLSRLAAHHWNLEATASSLKQSKVDLVLRLENAGFGYLLKDHVLAAARRRRP